jgi:uncharacterized protein YcgI (DUF1989 family)
MPVLVSDVDAAGKLLETICIPARHGHAFEVMKGQVLRLTQKAGPQVIDFNAWDRSNPREMFWAGRTRIIEGAHPSAGSRLWSVEPWMRPMFTIIADTADQNPSLKGSYNHDLWYPRCGPGFQKVMGEVGDGRSCHVNLVEAVKPFGLGAECVHDTFNVFMRTGLDSMTQKFFIEPSDARLTDYMDLKAEMDCLVALSSCPGFSDPNIHDVVVEIYEPGHR